MYQSINPVTEEVIATRQAISSAELDLRLTNAVKSFQVRRQASPGCSRERQAELSQLSKAWQSHHAQLVDLLMLEIGKLRKDAEAEVNKCYLLIESLQKYGDSWLTQHDQQYPQTNTRTELRPLGLILGVMPFNYPYWQVFRFALSALFLGNSVLIKPALNAAGCSLLLEEIFKSVFHDAFQVLLISESQVTDTCISDARISGVTLTGSARAGSAIAEACGRHLKKSCLELGGSDAYVIWPDADIDKAVADCVSARLVNSGQSCVAAKRFFVHQDCFEEVLHRLSQLSAREQIAPLARKDLLDHLNRQVASAIQFGDRLVFQSPVLKKGFFSPIFLFQVKSDASPLFQEETFGPVFALSSFCDDDDLVTRVNRSDFGLGAALYSSNKNRLQKLSAQLDVGMIGFNTAVQSSPELAFGGLKKSGYGRELGYFGFLEWANVQTQIGVR